MKFSMRISIPSQLYNSQTNPTMGMANRIKIPSQPSVPMTAFSPACGVGMALDSSQ
jgi:hypothetical protein